MVTRFMNTTPMKCRRERERERLREGRRRRRFVVFPLPGDHHFFLILDPVVVVVLNNLQQEEKKRNSSPILEAIFVAQHKGLFTFSKHCRADKD